MTRLLLSFIFVCVLIHVGKSIKFIVTQLTLWTFVLVGITWKWLPVFPVGRSSSLKSLNDRFYQNLDDDSAVACFRLTNATSQIGCSGMQVVYFLSVCV